MGVQATKRVGLSLVLFILSLPVVLRPRTFRDIFLLGLAALSPMTVYALERANNDLVVYLLIVCASALLVVSRLYRLCPYALFLTAGLLKYYPLVLLLLLAPRTAAARDFGRNHPRFDPDLMWDEFFRRAIMPWSFFLQATSCARGSTSSSG